jgi:hypothetical protein
MNITKLLTTSAALLAASVLLPGCVSYGKMPAVAATQIELAGNNYKIIKMGAKGTSTGFSIIGIPFRCSSMAEAKEHLYKSVGEPLDGRPVALTHQTEDHAFKSFILFSTDQITLTAEVVEFTDKPGTK